MNLENEYFVFNYSADFMQHPAFSICKVVDGVLKDVWEPAGKQPPGREADSRENSLAIEYLKKNNVTQVYTIKPEFVEQREALLFGKRLEEFFDQDNWEFYDSILEQKESLEKEGIEVLVYES